MAKRKTKPLRKRQREFEMPKPFSHWVLEFNDCFHIRLCAPDGEIYDYYPVSEKFRRKGGKLFNHGYGNLIDYLNKIS